MRGHVYLGHLTASASSVVDQSAKAMRISISENSSRVVEAVHYC